MPALTGVSPVAAEVAAVPEIEAKYPDCAFPHSVCSVEAWNLPSSHAVHAVFPVPAEYRPAGQAHSPLAAAFTPFVPLPSSVPGVHA